MPESVFSSLYKRAIECSKNGDGAGLVAVIQEARRKGLNPADISILSTLGEGALQFPLSGHR